MCAGDVCEMEMIKEEAEIRSMMEDQCDETQEPSRLSYFQRASIYVSIFGTICISIVSIIPVPEVPASEVKSFIENLYTWIKILSILIIFSYLFTYLKGEELKDFIRKEIRAGSRVEFKCHNARVIDKRIRGDFCYITVTCEHMGDRGCPERCPHFRRPVPTGSGAVAGGIIGAVIGTVIAPGLGTVAGGLLGALYGNAVEDAGLRSTLEREIDKCKAQRKTVYVKYVPAASLA